MRTMFHRVGRSLIVTTLLIAACDRTPAAGDDGGLTDGAVSSDGAASRWRGHAPLLLGPRQETAVVAAAGRIFVIGGFTANAEVVATVDDRAVGARVRASGRSTVARGRGERGHEPRDSQ